MAPEQKPGKSKQDYRTPPEFIIAVKKLFGIKEFSIDLAADCYNTQATKYYTEQDSAFDHDWSKIEPWAWCNPPFTKIGDWVCKAYTSTCPIIMLVPASVGANWWKAWVHHKAWVYFLNGRLAFIPDKPKWLYPKDLALLAYDPAVKDEIKDYNIWTWRKEATKSLAEDTQL